MADGPGKHHLRVITGDGELADDVNQQIYETEMALRAERSKNTRLRNELAKLREVSPQRDAVLSVLECHRDYLMPGAKISEHTARWGVVEALLKMKEEPSGRPLLTALELKAAVVGMTLQPFIMDRANRYARDLTWAFTSQPPGKPGGKPGPRFPDPAQVQKHISHAIKFKRETGLSALEIVEELGGPALRWLAERCGCGHTWFLHLRGGEAAQGGAQACSVEECGCGMFDHFHAKVERFMREAGD